MISVLIVDDEEFVLSALKRALQPFQQRWKVRFELGGPAGRSALESERFDVLITDMIMSDVDGAELLQLARTQDPATIRVLMTDSQDTDAIMTVAPLAHRVLNKPFTTSSLTRAVLRVHQMQAGIHNDDLRQAIYDIETLPSHPRVFFELSQALQDPHCGASEVADIIEQDPGLSAKSLQLVNSGFFAFERVISSMRHAVALMGVELLRGVILSTELRQAFVRSMPSSRLMGRLQQHSMRVGTLAGQITEVDSQRPLAFAAGVLHEIGQLILWSQVPHLQKGVARTVRKSGRPLIEVEREVYGVTHAEVGAHLLGLWGVADPIVEAVALHHQPWKRRSQEVDIVVATFISERLAETWGTDLDPFDELDPEWAARLDLDSRTEAWLDLAREQLDQKAA